ncbi:hypothetical protein EVAR_5646_1 [Eumeta japonica]|uniref:Uncharacterized protein n=1 Tax=Eumeta variegata TaxID=151549 RepID=A0A4C1T7D7_EUMVA|nr:hypothetical protein EVAR_5646_1 [Eumeta japonica]
MQIDPEYRKSRLRDLTAVKQYLIHFREAHDQGPAGDVIEMTVRGSLGSFLHVDGEEVVMKIMKVSTRQDVSCTLNRIVPCSDVRRKGF